MIWNYYAKIDFQIWEKENLILFQFAGNNGFILAYCLLEICRWTGASVFVIAKSHISDDHQIDFYFTLKYPSMLK